MAAECIQEINSMQYLQIGLKNLRKIERGHVMIGNCEKLCYYKTIDWNLLGTELKTQNMSTDCEAMTCPAQCSGKYYNKNKK